MAVDTKHNLHDEVQWIVQHGGGEGEEEDDGEDHGDGGNDLGVDLTSIWSYMSDMAQENDICKAYGVQRECDGTARESGQLDPARPGVVSTRGIEVEAADLPKKTRIRQRRESCGTGVT